MNTVPTAVFRHHTAALCEAWAAATPPVSGCGVALAVRAAAEAVGDVRGEAQLSVVWTGPASYAVRVRATGAVLAEVIEGAAKTLVVVSFAAYKVAAVVDALQAAAARGVDVHLVLESVVESKGKLSLDAKRAFDALGEAVSFYVWPAELRVSVGGGHAAMHAKCAVADRHTAFVTSANLTGAAMTDNMELGLVVRGGASRSASQPISMLSSPMVSSARWNRVARGSALTTVTSAKLELEGDLGRPGDVNAASERDRVR